MRWAVVTLLVVVGASVARADEATIVDPFDVREPRALKAAAVLFDEGRRLLAKGDDEGACEHFAKSLILEPAPGTEMNLASCKVRRHELAEAWHLFTHAAKQLRASGADARATFAQEHADGLVPLLATITVEVDVDLDLDVTVEINATRVATARNITTYVDPGPVTVVARAKDGRELRRDVTAVAGRTAVVQLAQFEMVVPPLVPTDPPRRRSWRIAAGVIVLVGVVVVITGVTQWAAASARRADGIAAAHCTEDRGEVVCGSQADATLADAAIANASQQRNIGTGIFVGGLVLAGVAAGVYAFAPRERTVVTATATTTSVGVAFTTRF